MTILEHTNFTNPLGDTTDIRLLSRNGVFEVIINVERTRRTTEKRFKAMEIVELKVQSFTTELEIIEIPLERMAVNEYNMRRAIAGDPTYSMADYLAWQKTQQEEK